MKSKTFYCNYCIAHNIPLRRLLFFSRIRKYIYVFELNFINVKHTSALVLRWVVCFIERYTIHRKCCRKCVEYDTRITSKHGIRVAQFQEIIFWLNWIFKAIYYYYKMRARSFWYKRIELHVCVFTSCVMTASSCFHNVYVRLMLAWLESVLVLMIYLCFCWIKFGIHASIYLFTLISKGCGRVCFRRKERLCVDW